jgi:hypothetical protein
MLTVRLVGRCAVTLAPARHSGAYGQATQGFLGAKHLPSTVGHTANGCSSDELVTRVFARTLAVRVEMPDPRWVAHGEPQRAILAERQARNAAWHGDRDELYRAVGGDPPQLRRVGRG